MGSTMGGCLSPKSMSNEEIDGEFNFKRNPKQDGIMTASPSDDTHLEYPKSDDFDNVTNNTNHNHNKTHNTNHKMSNSSNSSESFDKPPTRMPPLQQIPSNSITMNSKSLNGSDMKITIISPETNHLLNFNDPEIEIFDKSSLAATKSSSSDTITSVTTEVSQSDIILHDDHLNHINNKENININDQNEDEDDEDEESTSSHSLSIDGDEEIEPMPSTEPPKKEDANDNDNDNDTEEQKLSVDELSNITFNCIQSANATQAGTKNGKLKTNQDSFFAFDEFGPSQLFQLYGVCDGHGPDGNYVSKFVTDHLPKIIDNLLTSSLHEMSISSILKQSFNECEQKLHNEKQENVINFDIDYSGTTATIGLICGNKMYIANIGDSRTVLGRMPPTNTTKKKLVPIAIALSNDHDPTNKKEIPRIQKSKSGKILFDDDNDARIQIELPPVMENASNHNELFSLNLNDSLPKQSKKGHRRTGSIVRKISASVSRSIGDKIAHEYGGLISSPEITIHEIIDDDIFVIFASDGIWTMIDNDDVMRVIGIKLNSNKNVQIYDDLDKITKRLVKEANLSWQDEYEDYTDDITCVVARIGKIEK